MHAPTTVPTRVEPSARRVRVVFAGETIADSTDTRLVWENDYYPQYYFPRSDVRVDLLAATGHLTGDPALGEATHYTVQAGEQEAPNGAWQYSDSPVEAVRDLIRFDWAAMDRWYEEDEEVFVHPRNPYTRVDILESRRHILVEIDGVVVADSVRPKLLFETRMPTRYYLPPDDVRFDLLTPTGRTTRCPYKGVARYWAAEVDGLTHPDIVWSYETPVAAAAKITGLMCFFNEKLDIVVDGEDGARPVTTFS